MNKIIVYEHGDFRGLSKEFTRDVPNLVSENFNDCISSLKVIGMPWVAYEHTDYQGRQILYEEGQYPSVAMNDTFSSLKIITDNLDDPFISLYEDVNYGGRRKDITTETNLCFADFNDKASSHIVQRGAWVLYEDVNRGGRQIVARAGERMPDYGALNFNDKLSSLRPLQFGSPSVQAKILWEKMIKESEKNVKIDELVGINHSDSEQAFSSTATKEYETYSSESVTFSNSTTITVGTTFSLAIMPGVGIETSMSVSNTFNVEKGKTESKTTREKTELTLPVKIPPHTKLTVNVMRKEMSVRVPVEFTVTRGNNTKIEYGEYRCSCGSSVHAEYSSERI
ncbi:epidermal differentiation-specific protein-like isoform X3 [Erpetoichthys calabaricus]|uniref:epidermal differentiation-specific protein-like isoform X3 n=1 Tax=Erpetoichthys calabaricus TaxID=27687 RepID=UPI0022348E23|nr:epidermal differentiation-specific protein-like isoform X3 [Erpetoichthys calabaricus]